MNLMNLYSNKIKLQMTFTCLETDVRVPLHCKCKVCGKIIPNWNEVIDNIMKQHEAKLVMEKYHNLIVCLKARH